MEPSHADLWSAWQRQRDASAFEALVRPVVPALFDVARRSGLRASDADDVVQDALTELAREPGGRPGRVGVAPWLMRSVRLRSKMAHRSEARRRAREQAAARPEVHRDDQTGDSAREEVERALDSLAEEERHVLLLRFLYDLEYREVAHVLGISVNACRIRVHRATQRLRERLGPKVGPLVAALPLAPVPDASARIGQAVAGAGAAVVGTAGASWAVVTLVALFLGAAAWFVALGANDPHDPRAGRGGARDDAIEVEAVHLRGSSSPSTTDAASEQEPAGLPPHVVGRVWHADGRSAGGVEVELSALGHAVAPVRTDAEGRYRIPVGPLDGTHPPRALVVARDAEGRAGRTPVFLIAGGRDVLRARTSIVLEPSHALDVAVRRDGEPVEGARVVLAAVHEWGWAGLAEVRSDADGRAAFERLAPGGYVVLASGGADRAVDSLAFPPDAGTVLHLDLRPAARELTVRVLDDATGEPIEGAHVVLRELGRGFGAGWRYEPQPVIASTGADGVTTIAGLDVHARLQVVARKDGYASSDGSGRFRSQGRVRSPRFADPGRPEIVVRLVRPAWTSWPIEDGEVPRPKDGTLVVLKTRYGEAWTGVVPDARIEGGRLHARILRGAGFVAFLPDGSHAVVRYREGDGDPAQPAVRFLAPRRCVVTLRHADGTPAEGWRVQLGQHEPVFGPRAAGSDGVVEIDGLPDAPLGLHLMPPESVADLESTTVGATVVHAHGGRFEVRVELEVPATREVRLRLRCEDRSCFPPGLRLSEGGLALHWSREPGAAAAFDVLARDEGLPCRVLGSAFGYASFTFDVPVGEDEKPYEHGIDLVRAGEAWLRVTPPADGRMHIELQRQTAPDGAWARGGWPWWLEGEAARTRRWAGLASGRHRFVDESSGLKTEPFDVVVGQPAPVVELDLSEVAQLHGRIVVPDGHDPSRSRLRVEGRPVGTARADTDTGDVYVRPDGTFVVRVTPTRIEMLTLSHPELAPDAGSDAVEISGHTAGVTLRLVEDRLARFRLHPDSLPRLTPDHLALPPRVRLYAGGLETAPVVDEVLRLAEGEGRIGGYEPGTYTLWLDIPPFAPRVLEDVRLGAGTTDLGEVRLEIGLAVRVRVLPREAGGVGLLNLQAQPVEGPDYVRGILERQGHEITLRGLRPGRHRVTLAEGVMSRLDEVIEVEPPDGASREVALEGR